MPALAATFGLTADQGATFEYVFTWTNPDDTVINLQGYKARMTIRRNTPPNSVVETLTTDNGRIVLGGDAGTVTLKMTSDVTAALPASRLQYDLELESSSGEVTRLLMGYFVVRAEMTK
jgi:hypothetical protein